MTDDEKDKHIAEYVAAEARRSARARRSDVENELADAVEKVSLALVMLTKNIGPLGYWPDDNMKAALADALRASEALFK